MKRLGKIGFVGAGGGYKGAISVGILKALYEAGIEPSYAFAASVNVLNFAELITKGIDNVIKTWKALEKKGDSTLFAASDVPLRLWKPAIFDNNGVKQLVSNIDIRALTAATIPMEFPVVNETQGRETEIISNHDERFQNNPELLGRYMLASVSVPGLLFPIQIGNDWYSDGQYISLQSAIRAGCDTIFVLLNDYHGIKNTEKDRWYIRFIDNYNMTLDMAMKSHIKEILEEHKDYTIFEVGAHVPFFRKFLSMAASVAQGDMDLVPHRIIPIAPKGPVKGLGSVGFSKNSISLAIDHGYECGREVLLKLLT